ncbi:MFS transporter [Micrococcaceae bacterium Sec5.7]
MTNARRLRHFVQKPSETPRYRLGFDRSRSKLVREKFRTTRKSKTVDIFSPPGDVVDVLHRGLRLWLLRCGCSSVVPSWRAVYAGSAVLLLLLAALAVLRLPKESAPAPTISYARAISSVVTLTRTDRVFRTRAVMTLFLFASFGVLWSGLVLPLSGEPWHFSTAEIGLFGIAGLFGALGAARAGRWADHGPGQRVTAISLLLLIVSWAFTGQATNSLALLAVGVIVLDFAVQAAHVSSQNQIVRADPASSSRIIGSYMVYYSVGSALGAITTTMPYTTAGWAAVSLLGAGYATAALLVRGIDRIIPSRESKEQRQRR